MNRRTFLQTAAASVAVSACGSGDSSPPNPSNCDQNATPSACPGLPPDSYFQSLTQQLQEQYGTPQMLIDADRVKANAATIVAGARSWRYRIVEKSLPSLDLLRFVKDQTGSNRFLVLHLPFLPEILRAFPDAQVLVGKSQPTKATTTFLDKALPEEAIRVTWLVDSVARLNDLIVYATQTKKQLNVAVEIDVGLHRGGVRTPADLPDVLKTLQANTPTVTFAGMLGYDGHVSGAPSVPGLEERTIRAAFNTMQDTYQSFKDVLTGQFSGLVRDGLIFNSGGTDTYSAFPDDSPVNDVAAGGGMLRPSSYGSPYLGALTPASFIAAPVLSHSDRLELPYVTDLTQSQTDNGQGFTMYGGGWAANPVYPAGVASAPFVSDSPGLNQVPNKSWMYGPASPRIDVGDWVFHQPILADSVIQFENLLVVEGGQLTGEVWKPFPRRY
jgi:D-serine deaminase-like pyridoxal phosphate-dependent protein